MNHANAIKKLMPLDLGDISNSDIDIEGMMLDQAAKVVNSCVDEAFPSTAKQTISRWEAEYAVEPADTIEDRRNAVVAKMRQRSALKYGGLRIALYKSIAQAMGYTIEIVESGDVFRAGINAAGDAVYSATTLYSVTITVSGVSSADDLVALFNDIFPPYININFTFI